PYTSLFRSGAQGGGRVGGTGRVAPVDGDIPRPIAGQRLAEGAEGKVTGHILGAAQAGGGSHARRRLRRGGGWAEEEAAGHGAGATDLDLDVAGQVQDQVRAVDEVGGRLAVQDVAAGGI